MTEQKKNVETNSKKKLVVALASAALLVGAGTVLAANAEQPVNAAAEADNENQIINVVRGPLMAETSTSTTSTTSTSSSDATADYTETTEDKTIDFGAFQFTATNSTGKLLTIKAPADYVVDANKGLNVAIKVDGVDYALKDAEQIALSKADGTVSVVLDAAGQHFVEIDSYLVTIDATAKTKTIQNYNPQTYITTTASNAISAVALPMTIKKDNIETVFYTNKIFQKDSYYITVRFGTLPAGVSSYSVKLDGDIVKKDGVAQTFGTNLFNKEYKVEGLKDKDSKLIQVVYNYTDPDVKDAKAEQIDGKSYKVVIGADAYVGTTAQRWANVGKWAIAIAVPTLGLSLVIFLLVKIIGAFRSKRHGSYHRGYRR